MHPGIGNGNIAVVQPDPKKNAYAVHHGGSGKYDLLIIPVTRVTGVECGALTGDTFLNLWPHAFKEAQKRFPGADVIAGINSMDGRTKNQLHIHLTAFFSSARKKLDELNITTKPVDWNKKEAMPPNAKVSTHSHSAPVATTASGRILPEPNSKRHSPCCQPDSITSTSMANRNLNPSSASPDPHGYRSRSTPPTEEHAVATRLRAAHPTVRMVFPGQRRS